MFPSHICSHTMRFLGCQHTDVVFNITHTVADKISNGNAAELFRNDLSFLPFMYILIWNIFHIFWKQVTISLKMEKKNNKLAARIASLFWTFSQIIF